MQRFFRLMIWDALFCIVLSAGTAAAASLTTSRAVYIVNLLSIAVCGAFLSQLSRWGSSRMELFVVALPALYLALAPFLAPWLNSLPLSFDLVPAALLSNSTVTLRTGAALAAGFVLWQHVFISIPHR